MQSQAVRRVGDECDRPQGFALSRKPGSDSDSLPMSCGTGPGLNHTAGPPSASNHTLLDYARRAKLGFVRRSAVERERPGSRDGRSACRCEAALCGQLEVVGGGEELVPRAGQLECELGGAERGEAAADGRD
jgi:hypothetical protein